MSTDFQQAREALGARLRELRTEAGLNGKDMAARLGWQRSKVSRLENGKQTATDADVTAWARAAEQLNVAVELKHSLRNLEKSYRSWKRHLAAGHRATQIAHAHQEAQAATIHIARAHRPHDLHDGDHGPSRPTAAHRAAVAWMFRWSTSTPTVASHNARRRLRCAARAAAT
ncbi:helix-turn-helix domain-containing protein [Streptomyces sp. NPDC093600]|uniref:helix-turn-helix domain-containing protein n=1 Tax=Streptomyces sp. NPDC093600 TaxID=3366047 RepID=UPI0038158231